MSSTIDTESAEGRHSVLSRMLTGPGRTPGLHWFGGSTFAIRGDVEPINHLFEVEGVLIAEAGTPDETALPTLRQVILFRDSDTGNVMTDWRNPYTNAVVPVAVIDRPLGAIEPSTLMPWYVTDEKIVAVLEHHRAARDSSIQQFVAWRRDMDRGAAGAVQTVGTWQTTSGWWPWMKMDGAPGYLFTRMFMKKYQSASGLSEELQDALKSQLPETAL